MNLIVKRAGMMAVLLSIPLSCALASSNVIVGSSICVTSQNSAWVLAPNNGGSCVSSGDQASPGDPLLPATFTTPEPASETTMESVGDFTFNTSFSNPQGYYTIREGDLPSDYILFGNTASGGDGEVFFYSDMTPRDLTGFTNNGILCAEGSNGCVGTFVLNTALGNISVHAASDGETRPFDPFSLGSDYSDGISFAQTPEPAQAPIVLAIGLAAFFLRHSLRSAAESRQ